MRDVKFRAFINKLNCYADYVVVISYKYVHGYSAYKDNVEYVNVELEEFTGLYDVNNKPVYEGDIIEAFNHNPKYMEIKFVEGGFCADWGDSNYPIDINHFYDSKGCHLKVVGNVNENPNILKGGK